MHALHGFFLLRHSNLSHSASAATRYSGESASQPAAALVDATDQHQQFIAGGIDAGGERHDGGIEFVDVRMAMGLRIGRGIAWHVHVY